MEDESYRRTPVRDDFQARVRGVVEEVETISVALNGMALELMRGQPDREDTRRNVELMLRLRDLALAEQAWAREFYATTDAMLERYRTSYRYAMARIEVQAGLLIADHPDSRVPQELDDFLSAWKEWSTV